MGVGGSWLGSPSWPPFPRRKLFLFCFVLLVYMGSESFSWWKLFLLIHSCILILCSSSGMVSHCCTVASVTFHNYDIFQKICATRGEGCWKWPGSSSFSVHHLNAGKFILDISNYFITLWLFIVLGNLLKGTVTPDLIGLKVIWLDRPCWVWEPGIVSNFTSIFIFQIIISQWYGKTWYALHAIRGFRFLMQSCTKGNRLAFATGTKSFYSSFNKLPKVNWAVHSVHFNFRRVFEFCRW